MPVSPLGIGMRPTNSLACAAVGAAQAEGQTKTMVYVQTIGDLIGGRGIRLPPAPLLDC